MAFKLRSGNTTPFKQLGSSQAKRDPKKDVELAKEYEKANNFKYDKKISGPEPKASIKGKQIGPGGPRVKPVPKINMPKGFAPNISDEQRAKSKGTLKGITGFQADLRKIKPLTAYVDATKQTIKSFKKSAKAVKKGGKKVYDYFTKK